MGSEVPKQYQPIAGVPMVLRAVRPFMAHPDVARIALVLPPDDAATPPDFLVELIGERLLVAAGGAERGASVAAGLAALGDDCAIVLVHDGARPLVGRPVIDAVIGCARGGEGAIAALPVSDTLKAADATKPEYVARTLPRDRLWRAQTPQGFPRAVLAEALARAKRDGRVSTDDAALVEALGVSVRLIPDSPRNLKVTTPDDLALAECLVEGGA